MRIIHEKRELLTHRSSSKSIAKLSVAIIINSFYGLLCLKTATKPTLKDCSDSRELEQILLSSRLDTSNENSLFPRLELILRMYLPPIYMYYSNSFNISLQAVCLHVCGTGWELNSVVQQNTKPPNRREFTLVLPMTVVCLLSCFKTLKTSMKLFFFLSNVLSTEIS